MLGQLLPCGGGRPIGLVKPKLIVGRVPPCDIVLPFASVSSRHCELDFRDGCWHVHDLGSKNGTYVNGMPCQSQSLLPDDVLSVAKYSYRVGYEQTPRAGDRPQQEPRPDAKAEQRDAARASAPLDVGPLPVTLPHSSSAYGYLIPCGGGEPIALRKRKIVIGRNSDCDVVLRFATISGRHCELEWHEDRSCWKVRDLSSRNGTRVDGVACVTNLLEPGSVLGVAGLRYQVVDRTRKAQTGDVSKAPIFAQSLLEAAGLEHWRPKETPQIEQD